MKKTYLALLSIFIVGCTPIGYIKWPNAGMATSVKLDTATPISYGDTIYAREKSYSPVDGAFLTEDLEHRYVAAKFLIPKDNFLVRTEVILNDSVVTNAYCTQVKTVNDQERSCLFDKDNDGYFDLINPEYKGSIREMDQSSIKKIKYTKENQALDDQLWIKIIYLNKADNVLHFLFEAGQQHNEPGLIKKQFNIDLNLVPIDTININLFHLLIQACLKDEDKLSKADDSAISVKFEEFNDSLLYTLVEDIDISFDVDMGSCAK